MVTHVVAWNFNDDIKEEDKALLKADMKKNLESLTGKVPGLLSARFISEPLPGSNREMALVTTHETAEDIIVYKDHPAHVEVAVTCVRPFTKDRASINY